MNMNIAWPSQLPIGLGKMTWNTKLAEKAQLWADKCIEGHDTKTDRAIDNFEWVGQNWGGGISLRDVLEMWIGEFSEYNYKTGACKWGMCGHYTQVVWENTTDIGCGKNNCSNKLQYASIVCNYGPGGNYIGRKPYIKGSSCSLCPNDACSAGLCRKSRQLKTELI